MQKRLLIFGMVFLVLIHLSYAQLGVSICKQDQAGALAQINRCYSSCETQYQSFLTNYQEGKKKLDLWYDNLPVNCPDYSSCAENCKLQEPTNPLSCLKAQCFSLSKTCENNRLVLKKQVANDYYSYMSCFCKNCILPACRYLKSSDCKEKTASCDKARLDALGAKYPSSVKSFIGCNSSQGIANSLTQIAINSVKNAKNKPKSTTTNSKNKNPIASKLIDIAQKKNLKIIKTMDKNGENIKLVVPKVKADMNKQPGLFFKSKMHIQNNAVNNVFDNTLGKIPLLKYYKDYIIDDLINIHKSDETKIKETQVTLNVNKNAAKQYNDMSGIEIREKKLSPLKNAIPTGVVTEPFDYVIKQMGTGIKKCVAHGYEKEYKIAKEHAQLLRKSGLSWAQTIAQTTKLTGEDTGGYRYVQTLNAQSKGDYKLQGARIKNYIYQMRDTGELK